MRRFAYLLVLAVAMLLPAVAGGQDGPAKASPRMGTRTMRKEN